MSKIQTDLDLPPSKRTQANLWQAKYFEMYKEVVKANKGIRRLKRRLNRYVNQSHKDDSEAAGQFRHYEAGEER